ncbi:MAG: hypothetical protein KDG51_20040 [Calditrichaeota bacterium]|nr:hypothetical protein [Calditrichota bacterium]
MSFTLTYFKTGIFSCTVSANADITNITNKINIEDVVGDEFTIKSGDLSLETYNEISGDFGGSYHNWVAVYWDAALVNVYYMGSSENVALESHNDKTGKYKYRLISIQQVFYDALGNTGISDPAGAVGGFREWGYELAANSALEIQEIKTSDSTSETARFGYSLFDIIANLKGTSTTKSNYMGFYCSDYSFQTPMILKDSDALPILFRGQSYPFDLTPANYFAAINGTFDGVNWLDIFKIAMYYFNCYLLVVPAIGTYLTIEYRFVSKTDESASGSAATWIERQLVYRRYRCQGAKLNFGDTELSLGNIQSDDTIGLSLDISDPNEDIDAENTTLYLAKGDYNAAGPDYDILTGLGKNDGFLNGTDFQSYYSGFITGGDGYEGRIKWAGEKALDQIAFDSTTIQLIRLDIDQNGFANIEGIII